MPAAKRTPQPRRPRDLAVAAGASAAVLAASLGNFLNHNEYPAFSAEVGLAVLALLGAALVVALLYNWSGRFGRRLLDFLLLYLAIDLNFDIGIAAAPIACAGAILLHRHLLPALGFVFSVVLVGQFAALATGQEPAQAGTAPATTSAPGAPPPVLVHVVLDEHIGIEGLPADMPAAAAMRGELTEFYARHGFRLFGGAYSEHMHTINSLPYLLNFGAEQPWRPGSKETGVALARNAYFDALRALGYALNVYQTDFVDYCAGQQVRSCTEFSAAALRPLADTGLTAGEKAQIILFSFWSLSDAVDNAARVYDALALALSPRIGLELPLLDMDLYQRTSTTGALDAAERLLADLDTAAPGQAYFAHLLLPHYPYATNRDCSVKPIGEWLKRRSARTGLATRHEAYFDQLGCVLDRVAAILERLAGKDSIVVLHGDHGSRITVLDPVVENAGQFSAADMVAGYSTLFAVRAPALAAGYEAARLPVARILEALARSGFRSADVDLAGGPERTVVIENGGWQPVERQALPPAWLQP